ncbi:MAG: hypothetical protein WDO56_11450 [Gammaproteobacteria bacterium]
MSASLLLFVWIVPAGVAKVTAGGTLAPKILDQYILTWRPDDARGFYAALGASGRAAYRQYYLRLDFWFPVLTLTLFYMSLFALVFRPGTRWGWLVLTPLAMYACDAAENLNHFSMAASYPQLSALSLTFGPWFTAGKWVLLMGLPLVAFAGGVGLFLRRRTSGAGADESA